MNILFLSLLDFNSIEEHSIYTDLLREFRNAGHSIFAISPVERRKNTATHIITEEKTEILKLKIGNIQKTNILEKGISTILIESLLINAIKKYYSDIHFDLVLYSTPPITFVGAIEYVKNRDNAKTYLLLKDIFPQNAVDLGMLKTKGIKSVMYKHFKYQEKRLYKVSDRIGCMSQANVDYLLKHNSYLNSNNIEICPNSIEIIDKSVSVDRRAAIRERYNIPLDKIVYIYGGNLGRPQGVPFIIRCLEKCRHMKDEHFLIIGNGTDYPLLEKYVQESDQINISLYTQMSKDDYDELVGACDVGLVFLDHRFTIPNYPSRVLSYMQAKLPVFAVTDPNTDIGKDIINGKFGWWCESDDSNQFATIISEIRYADRKVFGEAAYSYLTEHFSAKDAYTTISRMQ